MKKSSQEVFDEFLQEQAEQRRPAIEEAFNKLGKTFNDDYIIVFHDTDMMSPDEGDLVVEPQTAGTHIYLGYFRKYDGVTLSPGSMMDFDKIEDKRVFSDKFVAWLTQLAQDRGRQSAQYCSVLYKKPANR